MHQRLEFHAILRAGHLRHCGQALGVECRPTCAGHRQGRRRRRHAAGSQARRAQTNPHSAEEGWGPVILHTSSDICLQFTTRPCSTTSEASSRDKAAKPASVAVACTHDSVPRLLKTRVIRYRHRIGLRQLTVRPALVAGSTRQRISSLRAAASATNGCVHRVDASPKVGAPRYDLHPHPMPCPRCPKPFTSAACRPLCSPLAPGWPVPPAQPACLRA